MNVSYECESFTDIKTIVLDVLSKELNRSDYFYAYWILVFCESLCTVCNSSKVLATTKLKNSKSQDCCNRHAAEMCQCAGCQIKNICMFLRFLFVSLFFCLFVFVFTKYCFYHVNLALTVRSVALKRKAIQIFNDPNHTLNSAFEKIQKWV